MVNFLFRNDEIYFEKEGIGPPLILLHGWKSNIEAYFPLRKLLKQKYTLYLIDIPPFGKSKSNYEYTLTDYVDLLYTFIKNNKLESFSIVGHSFGARIALHFQIKYKLAERLILIAPAFVYLKKISKRLNIYKYKIKKRVFKVLSYKRYEKLIHTSGSTDFINATNIEKQILINCVSKNFNKYLKSVEIPTLIIWGTCDKEVSYKMIKILKKRIKKSILYECKSYGHFPHVENPLLIFKKICEFSGG